MTSRAASVAEDDDPVGEREPIAAQRELARHVAVLGQDREQPWEGIEAGVRGQEQQQRRERLEQVEQDPVAVDRRATWEMTVCVSGTRSWMIPKLTARKVIPMNRIGEEGGHVARGSSRRSSPPAA